MVLVEFVELILYRSLACHEFSNIFRCRPSLDIIYSAFVSFDADAWLVLSEVIIHLPRSRYFLVHTVADDDGVIED